MKATEFYETPGIAETYIDWCVKANGCAPADAIIKIIRDIDDMRDFSRGTLVDLGSGPGTSMPMLKHILKFEKCILVDASDQMLNFAGKVFGHNRGLSTLKADLRSDALDIPDSSAEVVISCSTIPYLDVIENVILEASRITVGGGYFGFNGFFHLENNIETHPLTNDYGVDFYHHSLLKLRKLMKTAKFEEVGSVKIEKSPEEKQVEEFFRKIELPAAEDKEEVYNRLMVFEKH